MNQTINTDASGDVKKKDYCSVRVDLKKKKKKIIIQL